VSKTGKEGIVTFVSEEGELSGNIKDGILNIENSKSVLFTEVDLKIKESFT